MTTPQIDPWGRPLAPTVHFYAQIDGVVVATRSSNKPLAFVVLVRGTPEGALEARLAQFRRIYGYEATPEVRARFEKDIRDAEAWGAYGWRSRDDLADDLARSIRSHGHHREILVLPALVAAKRPKIGAPAPRA